MPSPSPIKPEANFSIRQATLADLDALVALRLDFLCEVNATEADEVPPDLRESLHAYFARSLPAGEFLAWLAEADGEIIGTSGLVFLARPPSYNNVTGLDAYVMNMYTLPAWRGRGVASALLRCVMSHVGTTPSRRVFLHATPQGRPIYQRAGFHDTGEEMELLIGS